MLTQVEIQVLGINLDTTERKIIVSINDSNDSSTQFLIITGLEEFVNYSIVLSVRNGAGLSPFSVAMFVATLASGRLCYSISLNKRWGLNMYWVR